MAIQVINDPYRYGGQQQPRQQNQGIFGQLGQGIVQGLQSVAHSKLEQLQRRHQYSDMSQRLQGLGLSAQEADYLATLPPKEQVGLLQSLSSGRQSQPSADQYSPDPYGQNQSLPQDQLGQTQPKSPSFLQALGQGASQKEVAALRKEEYKAAIKERQKLKEESKSAYDEAIKSGKAAGDIETHLDRMEKLVNKGNLPNAAYHRLLKKLEGTHAPFILGGNPATAALGISVPFIGSILSSIQNAFSGGDIEEFEKLSSDLIRGAKEIFGSRITDADLNAFLKTIPTLDQTDAGKLRVIKNMKHFNQAGKLRSDAAKRIIKDNRGIIPFDIKQRIEEEVGPQLNKISEQIVKGIEQAEKKAGSFAEVANEQLLQGIPLIPGSGIRSLTRR